MADLLFVVTVIPTTASVYATASWPLSEIGCKLFQYLIHVTCYSSVFTLVLLSLDRYLAVVYPVTSISLRTVCNTTLAICFVWAFTLVVCVPILFLYGTQEFQMANGETKAYCDLILGPGQGAKVYQVRPSCCYLDIRRFIRAHNLLSS